MAASDEPGEPIFAITVSSGWMHVYSTVDSLLTVQDIDSGPPDAVQFFDIRGRRLAPLFDRSWRLVGLRQCGTRANETAVCSSLLQVVGRLRESIEDRLAKSGSTEVTHEQALRQLPDLTGKNLAECYPLLRTVFGDGGGDPNVADDGSFWHNFFCHCC